MPTFNFSRQWKQTQFSESGYFISDELNDKNQDENDHEGVSIDDTQVNVEFKYKNLTDKTIHYTLTIQRSTGRFAENRFLRRTYTLVRMPSRSGATGLNLFCCRARFAFVSL
jgi:hypothetical protein